MLLKALYRSIRANHIRSLLVISTLLLLIAGTLYVAIYNPTGDEPHYLILSESLVKYHSFDASQIYRDLGVYNDVIKSHHIIKNVYGWWMPGHSPGGPILWLIPFFLLGRLGVIWFMAAIVVLIVYNLYKLLLALELRAQTAFAVSLCYTLASPFFIYAHLAFIEPIAALACVYTLRKCVEQDIRVPTILCASILLGIMPWLHIRFVPVMLVLAGFLLYRIYQRYGFRGWGPNIAYLLPLAMLFLALELYNWLVIGSWNPIALRLYANDRVFERWPFTALFGILFDQNFGLLICFPLCFLLFSGIYLAARRKRYRLYNIVVLCMTLPYLLSFTTFHLWFGGYSPPARFCMVLLPALALYMAYALDRLEESLRKRIITIAFWWGLIYNILSLLPPRNGFNDLWAHNMAMLFLHVGNFYLTDLWPAVYVPNVARNALWLLGYLALSLWFVYLAVRERSILDIAGMPFSGVKKQ